MSAVRRDGIVGRDPVSGHRFQGGRRGRGVRTARGRRACRDLAPDGINSALLITPACSHSRDAVQGQTRRKVGTQNHRSKGLPRKLDDSGVASSRCAAARIPRPSRLGFPLDLRRLSTTVSRSFENRRGKYGSQSTESFTRSGYCRVRPVSAAATRHASEARRRHSGHSRQYQELSRRRYALSAAIIRRPAASAATAARPWA